MKVACETIIEYPLFDSIITEAAKAAIGEEEKGETNLTADTIFALKLASRLDKAIKLAWEK